MKESDKLESIRVLTNKLSAQLARLDATTIEPIVSGLGYEDIEPMLDSLDNLGRELGARVTALRTAPKTVIKINRVK